MSRVLKAFKKKKKNAIKESSLIRSVATTYKMDKPQGQKRPIVPIVDRKVFRPLTRKEKRKLPHRKLYEVEVLDEATGTIPQVLDTLSTAGPFQLQGWIPIEDTIHTLGMVRPTVAWMSWLTSKRW